MFIDMLSQPDLPKFDLSSVEAGKSIQPLLKLGKGASKLLYDLIRSSVSRPTGIVAGSFCPPEVIRKVINVMGIEEMLVSITIKHDNLFKIQMGCCLLSIKLTVVIMQLQ